MFHTEVIVSAISLQNCVVIDKKKRTMFIKKKIIISFIIAYSETIRINIDPVNILMKSPERCRYMEEKKMAKPSYQNLFKEFY